MLVAADLRTPEEYEERFAELMAKRFRWLNLNYFGLIDGKGLVIVEFPDQRFAEHSPATSVNFSGPTHAVAGSGWDARAQVVFR